MATDIHKTIRWLRRHYRPRTPTMVRVVDRLPGCHGICLIGDGRALIKLAKATKAVMDDTLIEEFAHVLRELGENALTPEDIHTQRF